MAAAILFLPATWIAVLGLAQIRRQYPAPLGIAVLLPAAVLIIEVIVFASRWFRTRERQMPCERYTTDEFLGLRWRWSWFEGRAFGARAFCPRCDLEVDARSLDLDRGIMGVPTGELRYFCGRCGKTDITVQAYNPGDLSRTVELHAEREARHRGLL